MNKNKWIETRPDGRKFLVIIKERGKTICREIRRVKENRSTHPLTNIFK